MTFVSVVGMLVAVVGTIFAIDTWFNAKSAIHEIEAVLLAILAMLGTIAGALGYAFNQLIARKIASPGEAPGEGMGRPPDREPAQPTRSGLRAER